MKGKGKRKYKAVYKSGRQLEGGKLK